MPGETHRRLHLGSLLDAVGSASPVDAVDVLARELARMSGAEDVRFLIADFSGDALVRLATAAEEAAVGEVVEESVQLARSMHDRALRSQEVCVERRGDATMLYAPVTERGDALGVLEVSLPTPPDEELLGFVATAAHALSYVIIANRRHTDVFERGQRNLPFSLAAEIQRRLLPPAFTCEDAAFTLAGWLEPASDIGGDTFDYCVERDKLHLSISDAKGHTVHSAQLATLAVSSLRNARRGESGVVEQAELASAAIADHADEEDFVSALLLQVDASGSVAAVNAGHPTPRLVRDGVVSVVALDADLPFGMIPGSGYREQAFDLRPGDRLVLLTDGVLERNATSVDIADALLDVADLHPREVVHAFAQAVLDASGGVLQDDATLLCVDWYGPAADGASSSGASQERASDAVALPGR